MPAGAKMSMASMNAEPMMPKMVVTPLATIVSTKASLGVMRVISALLYRVRIRSDTRHRERAPNAMK